MSRLRVIDITRPLGPDTPVWPGDPPVTLEPLAFADGTVVTRLAMGVHCGTHVDFPGHLGLSAPRAELDAYIGEAMVVDVCATAVLDAAWASALPLRVPRLLLKSRGEFPPLVESGAQVLLQRGLVLIGTDAASIEPPPSLAVHRLLLGSRSAVVEGLVLDEVGEGVYHLACLPLCLPGVDGAPCRAVLWTP